MAKYKKILINSVLGGQSPSAYFGREDQFLASIGIDPALPVNSGVVDRPGGAIIPTRYETFTGDAASVFTGAPMWIETNPKNELVYSYLSSGKLMSYSNTLASETSIGTPTSGAGNGMKYYDNYIYLATPTNVSRYGPLNGSPSITNTYWTGTLGKTALTNTTYPSVRSLTFPNHAMHVHVGKLYFLDFKDGIGRVHFIQTQTTTVEGDTDNGSTYDALRLPSGYYPFDIESYGSDLIILCSQLIAGTPIVKQGKAMAFFWDTFSTKPYKGVEIPDALGTALLTHNGVPYIWSGAVEKGVRLSRYVGGNQIETVAELSEGTPPPAGAVDAIGNRISWGGSGTKPYAGAGVYSLGYPSSQLPSKALNMIAWIAAGSSPIVSSIKYALEGSVQPLVGWRSGSAFDNFGINKVSTSTSFAGLSQWVSRIIQVGQPFAVVKVRFLFGFSVEANRVVVPSINVDDYSYNTDLDTINNTTFPNSERNGVINCNVVGKHNFVLNLSFTNTEILPILLPIEITIQIFED